MNNEGDKKLIESTPTLGRAAEAGNLIILQWEFIIVGNLFVNTDWLFAINHNFFLALDSYHFCVTVRL